MDQVKLKLKKADVLYNKNQKLVKKYGIDLNEYAQMYADQLGCCAICGYSSFELEKMLVVDHCHKSLKIRSLLCQWCNTAIAYFKEDPRILKAAIAYLKKHK